MSPQTEAEIAEASRAATHSDAGVSDEDMAVKNPQEVLDAFKDVFGDSGEDDSSTSLESLSMAGLTDLEDAEENLDEELVGMEASRGETKDDGADADGEPADKGDESEEIPTVSDEDDDSGRRPSRTDKGNTLDYTLIQAAKRAGWSDGEIEELVATKPELAEKTFDKLRGSYNDLSAKFATIGKQIQQKHLPPGEQKQGEEAGTQDEGMMGFVYTPEKLSEFRDKYGEDFMEDVVKPVVDQFAVMQDIMAKLDVREHEQTNGEINQFFNALPPEYRPLYGDRKEVSEGQDRQRYELCVLADQIRAGAATQGIDLSVSEALSQANSLASVEFLRQQERDNLKQQVKKRSQNLTHRPTQRLRRTRSGTGTINDAIAAYKERAAELDFEVGAA